MLTNVKSLPNRMCTEALSSQTYIQEILFYMDSRGKKCFATTAFLVEILTVYRRNVNVLDRVRTETQPRVYSRKSVRAQL
jgi:hypothetical protein